MEETALPLHSWFWLIVPMATVFVLSILNFLKHRNRGDAGIGTPADDPRDSSHDDHTAGGRS